MSRSVSTPSGETWRISRRWLPNRRLRWQGPSRAGYRRTRPQRQKRRASALDWLDGLDLFDVENPLAGLAFVLAVVVVVALVWFVLVPVVLALVDVVVIAVLAGAGLVARVVFGRPWEIEAVGPTTRLTWQVAGWGRSRRAMSTVAERLARGQLPPSDLPYFP